MEDKYFVYVLWSAKFNRKYVGLTSDIENRLKEHNSGKTISTKAFVPWRIVYVEEYTGRLEARAREKYFKTAAGRRFLQQKLSLKSSLAS